MAGGCGLVPERAVDVPSLPEWSVEQGGGVEGRPLQTPAGRESRQTGIASMPYCLNWLISNTAIYLMALFIKLFFIY